jgi:prepilin-type N-terminal cleavage/methylation domain-containing protein
MRSRQRGFTLLEMLVVTAIIGVIIAVGVPALRDGRVGVSGGEAMAVPEMQYFVRAQTQYRARFGKYAASLAELASAEKDGYLFAMVGTRAGYVVVASPKIWGLNGRRSFYVNQDGVVRESRGERPASFDSPIFK